MNSLANAEAAGPQLSLGRWKRGLVIVTAYWLVTAIVFGFEMGLLTRFIARCAAWVAVSIAFAIWWLRSVEVPRRDRWLLLVGLAGATAITPLVAHRSLSVVDFLMKAWPTAFTALIVWFGAGRRFSGRVQRAGAAVLGLLVFGYFTLVRWDGFDGAQRAKVDWRWEASAEELFLATRTPASANTAAQETWTLRPGDWPAFRGTNRDGVVAGVRLADDWAETLRPVWRRRVGPAWSSLLLVDGFLVTQEQHDDAEVITCYRAATGDEVWRDASDARFSDAVGGPGPRATPTFADGRIVACGAKGELRCLDAASGRRLWRVDLAAEASAPLPQWGYASSPLVTDGLVVAFAGGRLGWVARRLENGEPAWERPGGRETYCSAQLVTLQGEPQILLCDQAGLRAVRPADGHVLWERLSNSAMGLPMLQAHVMPDGSLLAESLPGVARFDVPANGGNVVDRWTSNALRPSFNDYVVHDGHIYGLDDGILCCLDASTGKRRWKKGRFGHGQMLYLAEEAAALILTEAGELVRVPLAPAGLQEAGGCRVLDGKCWNHPIVSGDRVFVRNAEEMACYELRLR